MKALEFKTRIKNNRDKDIRVIVLIDDSDIYEDTTFQSVISEQFFKGYFDSDSIYDNY